MLKKNFVQIISMAVSLQMICAAAPQTSLIASAEADYYLS